MAGTTPNYGLSLPTVGGDSNVWGTALNDNTEKIDGFLPPSGIIVMWSGAIVAIPVGWLLCDGTLGTPDLRDRFVVGAGSTYAVDATGGAVSVALTEAQLAAHDHDGGTLQADSGGTHSHAGATAQSGGAHVHAITDPGHTHLVDRRAVNTPAGNNWGDNKSSQQSLVASQSAVTGISVNSGGAHTHAVDVPAGGAHGHTVSGTSAAAGAGAAHENRPPYLALAYIMKS